MNREENSEKMSETVQVTPPPFRPSEQHEEAQEAPRQEPSVKEAAEPARKPDLLLAPASDKKDIRPSDGWSFGTFSGTVSDTQPEAEEAKHPEEAPDEEQE